MTRQLLAIGLLVAALSLPARADTVAPRTVIALVDVAAKDTLKYSRIHQMATMPLNHLGLVVELHDLAKGLPDLDGRDDVRGILSWFSTSERRGAFAYLDWAEHQLAAGRRFVVLGEIGALIDKDKGAVPLDRVNRFLRQIGVQYDGSFVPLPVDMTYLRDDPLIWGLEDHPVPPPPFPVLHVSRSDATVHVQVGRTDDPDRSSTVVVTSPSGGFAADGYVADIDFGNVIRRWRIDPFRFFARAFGTDGLPKPDTTTLVGRRIFYSHVDGDGWRNKSEVLLDGKPASAAQVMLDRIVRQYPDLPVSVAPIAAEMNPDWVDDPVARETARQLFALPQVEPASHTYTHPFQWSFFKDYDPALENRIVEKLGRPAGTYDLHGEGASAEQEPLPGSGFNTRYSVPRAFYDRPFDLDMEIGGSIRLLQKLAGNRPVDLLQWSGDTTPFEAAIRATREAGIPNINGGDTRFDAEYPSYGFVAPVGVKVGAERQIYASNSNENTYTDLWTGRFFGFRHLQETLTRTESPIRIKPIDVYYHTYSAERVASLNAVIDNLEFARRHLVVPIRTSRFARIAEGFYSARFVALGDGHWRVEGRGALQTVRFDRATLRTVDLAKSDGVIGFRHLQGSLYVALDPAAVAPVIALKDNEAVDRDAPGARPYLIDSRWRIERLQVSGTQATMTVSGFGKGEMTWIVPHPGQWRVALDEPAFSQTVRVGDDLHLHFVLPADDGESARLSLAADGG